MSGAAAIGGLAAVLIVGAAVIALSRAAGRAQVARAVGGRYRRPARKSLVVTAAKSAGVKVTSDRLPGAIAELAGRAAGHSARRSRHHAGRAMRSARRHTGRLARNAGRRASAAARRLRGPQRAAQPPGPAVLAGAPNPGPAPAAPAASPAPAGPASATPRGAPVPVTAIPPRSSADLAGVPGDHQTVISRVAGFEPGDDTELIAFMAGECAAQCGYSDALRELFDTCTSGLGLDPSAVRGLADYADAMSEAAQAMARAHQRFVQVYSEVREAVARGVVMPHRGRFFSGQSA